MKGNQNIQFVPFHPKYENALRELEKNSVQGKRIKLEMLRDSLLTRSKIFSTFEIYVAVDRSKDKVVGVVAKAQTTCVVDGKHLKVGFGYDLKVDPEYRQMGIGSALAKKVTEVLAARTGIKKAFTTLKSENLGVHKITSIFDRVNYGFSYLTIPTHQHIKKLAQLGSRGRQDFKVNLFDPPKFCLPYYTITDHGLGIWRTYLIYQLKLVDMPWLMNISAGIANYFRSKKKRIPRIGETLKIATLFNFNQENICHINEVLQSLQSEGIQFLNICCIPGDVIYNAMKKYAANILPYCLHNTFDCINSQQLSVDVRCL